MLKNCIISNFIIFFFQFSTLIKANFQRRLIITTDWQVLKNQKNPHIAERKECLKQIGEVFQRQLKGNQNKIGFDIRVSKTNRFIRQDYIFEH